MDVALTEVRAGVDGQLDLVNAVIVLGRCLRSSKRALVVGIADIELVVVRGERLQIARLDLNHRLVGSST